MLKRHVHPARLLYTMFVAALLLMAMTYSGFAWYSIQSAPEVTTIAMSAGANDNLQIALDATGGQGVMGKEADGTKADFAESNKWYNVSKSELLATSEEDSSYYWGNVITVPEDAFQEAHLTPVGFSEEGDTSYRYPSYTPDGRVAEFRQASVSLSDTRTEKGYGTVKMSGETQVAACFIDIWFQTSAPDTSEVLLMEKGTARAEGAALEENEGGGSTILAKDLDENQLKGLTLAFEQDGKIVGYACAGESAGDGESALRPCNSKGEPQDGSSTGIMLEQNQATLIRVYIFENGDLLTNMGFADGAVRSATVNLQFGIDGVKEALSTGA